MNATRGGGFEAHEDLTRPEGASVRRTTAFASNQKINGRVLQQQRSEVPAGPETQNFNLVGAGVYNVHVSGSRALTQSGPQTREVSERGTFTIRVR